MKPVVFTPYDTAGYLKTKEKTVMYLDACLDEGRDDPVFMAHVPNDIARALGDIARARATFEPRAD